MKYVLPLHYAIAPLSGSARGPWIEISPHSVIPPTTRSGSARGPWIEITERQQKNMY